MKKEEIEKIKEKQYSYYEKIELKEGVPMQYMGSYILRWKNDACANPEYGFNETDDVVKLLAYVEELEQALRDLIDSFEENLSYKSEYLRCKHGDEQVLINAKQALDESEKK